MRRFIKQLYMRRVTDLARTAKDRARRRARREAAGAPRMLEYFHRFGDPASALMAPLMVRLTERFDVRVMPRLAGPPEAAAAPEPERLEVYGREDAARLARLFHLPFTDPGAPLAADRIARAEAAAADILRDGDPLDRICELDGALWSGADLPGGDAARRAKALATGTARRDQLGHFQSGAVFYEGEWYWGADRLHYLQDRLAGEGARRDGADDAALAPVLHESAQTGDAAGAVIAFYPSLRSPYTYLAAQRTFELARRWNAGVEIRFVLPMVMRNLPVPQRKGIYFLKDCAREADRLGLAFGNIADPVGRPTQRGLAVLAHAIRAGQGEAFLLSFLKGAWTEGLDAGSDRGLRTMAERAGMGWDAVRHALADPGWEDQAEANRARLTERGLWGVPSYEVGALAVWGQDRLWCVEEALAARAAGAD